MEDAKAWFQETFGVAPSLVLNGPRLFGLENEPPDDLLNIFYRCARYCITLVEKMTIEPSKKFIFLVAFRLYIVTHAFISY